MAQDSQINNTLEILEGQLRECFGRVVYSHKTHEKCADILLLRLTQIKRWQIILSAITTSGFIVAALGAGLVCALIGGLISTILLVLNAYTKDFEFGELAQKHRQAGAELWFIREKYLSLLTDLKMEKTPVESLVKQRDEILSELHAVYIGAPSTNFQAYSEAQKALKHSEDLSFSDEEIDAFLPKELKKIK